MTTPDNEGEPEDEKVDDEDDDSSTGPVGHFSDAEGGKFVKDTPNYHVFDIGEGVSIYECRFCGARIPKNATATHFSPATAPDVRCSHVDDYNEYRKTGTYPVVAVGIATDVVPDVPPEVASEVTPKPPLGVPEGPMQGEPSRRAPAPTPERRERERDMYDEPYPEEEDSLPPPTPGTRDGRRDGRGSERAT